MLFRSLPGFFSPFPHGTRALSVDTEYLVLEGNPPMFRQDFTCPALLDNQNLDVLYRTFTFLGWPSQTILISFVLTNGLLRFRSPLLTESLRFLFLRVLRCFSSPGLLPLLGDMSSTCRVAPFGHLRINSCVPIPAAFRSL